MRLEGGLHDVQLPNGLRALAWVVNDIETEFMAAADSGRALDADWLARMPVLFRIVVMRSAFRAWPRIGKVAVPESRSRYGTYFREDAARPGVFRLRTIGGDQLNGVPASRDECIGLEQNAVWSRVHVEERLTAELRGERSRWDARLRKE